jgi:hypothetical protein
MTNPHARHAKKRENSFFYFSADPRHQMEEPGYGNIPKSFLGPFFCIICSLFFVLSKTSLSRVCLKGIVIGANVGKERQNTR